MKAIAILDSEPETTHPMQGVLERRDFVVYRSATITQLLSLCQSKSTPIDLAIVAVPLSGATSQMDPAVQIRQAFPDMPLLLISDTPLEKWPESDFQEFGKQLAHRIDLLVKPLSQASFIAKVNALLYTVSYSESRKLFDAAARQRTLVAPA